tara:strand:+ start:82 stop:876 length:795 start_codon:yes stop_codon:yes gene_type:complete
MKKYFVVGKPLSHSLSPDLHNFWIKKHRLEAIYKKKEINISEIKNVIKDIRERKIDGINITVPFKKNFIPFLDELTPEASETQSVNTIFFKKDKIVGHNTDIEGFEISIKKTKYNIASKEVFILGGGGVVPSIIFALNKLKVSKIILANRTKEKVDNLKNVFKNLFVVNWGEVPNFDIIINATSIGLNIQDKINLDLSQVGQNKLFYDLIYNPPETNFLKVGKKLGNKVENGKMMFIHQASAAFKIWHGVEPKIDNDVFKLLEK